MNITHSQLIELVKSNKGAIALCVESVTDSKARKTGNPFGLIMKRARSSALCGVDYEAAVNRSLANQGDAPVFTSESIWNGKGRYVVPNKIVEHIETKRLYLAMQASDAQYEAFPAKVSYETTTGEEIPYDKAEPFLPEKKRSVKQEAYGLENNQRNVRMYALDSITAIHYKGQTLTVVAD